MIKRSENYFNEHYGDIALAHSILAIVFMTLGTITADVAHRNRAYEWSLVPVETEPVEVAEVPSKNLAIPNYNIIRATYILDQIETIDYSYITIEKEYIGRYFITAYCDCSKCCWPSTGKTASGTDTHYSDEWNEPTTCAIDRRIHGFGEFLMVDGKIYRTEDTGSAVKGHHIDVYRPNHDSVKHFDSHYSSVYKVTFTTHQMEGAYWNERINNYLLFSDLRRWGFLGHDIRIGD